MRRGTRVGNAYVALAVDGSTINKDIADAVDKGFDDVDYNAIGERHGEDYAYGLMGQLDAVEKRFDEISERMAGGLPSRLSDAIERDRSFGNAAEKMIVEAFGDGRLDELFSHVGERAGVNFSGQFGDALSERLKGVLIKSVKDSLSKGDLDLNDLLHGMETDWGNVDLLGPAVDRAIGDMQRLDKEMRRTREKEYAALFDQIIDSEKAEQDMERLHDMALRLNQRFDEKISADSQRRFEQDQKQIQTLGRMQDAALRMNAKFDAGRLDGPGMGVSGNDEKNFSVRIAALFGKGSRMDGLHYLGSTIGLVTKGLETMTSVGTRMFSTFGSGFASLGQNATLLSKMGAGFGALGGSFAAAGGGAAALGPALLALIPVIGALLITVAALVSAAAALATLLGSVLATAVAGVTGAVVALGGVFAAAAISGGLFALAITSMTDAQKAAMKDAFGPAKEVFTGLGQVILDDLIPAFDEWSTRLQYGATLLEPVAQRMGAAFRQVGNAITGAFVSDGFQKLAKAMEVFLPSITVKLGNAAGSFIDGLSATLAALMPMINKVAGYIENIAAKWAAWANDTGKDGGQNAIVDFANRAMAALSATWDIIRETFGLVKDFFFSPESLGTGTSIFETIAEKISGLREKVQKMAEDGTLAEWFETAMRFGAGLWATIKGIGGIIGQLVSSGGLDALAVGFEWLGKVFEWIGDIGPKVIAGLASGVLDFVELIGHAVDTLVGLASAGTAALNGVLVLYNAIPKLPDIGLIGGGNVDVVGAFKDSYNNGVAAWADDAEKAIQNWATGAGKSEAPKKAGTKAGSTFGKGFLDGFESLSMGDLFKDLGGDKNRLQTRGNDALNQTTQKNGGYLPDKPEYVNPYVSWANSLIQTAPSMQATIKKAVRGLRAKAVDAIQSATGAKDGDAVAGIMEGMIQSMRDSASNSVDSAKSAISTAAQTLANATSADAAAKALARVKAAQKDLKYAEAAKKKVDKAIKTLSKQDNLTSRSDRFLTTLDATTAKNIETNRKRLETLLHKNNTTLADYAVMREALAERITAAETSLKAAIELRDNYQKAVADSVRQFGSILSAEAKTVDGVVQSLTAKDITDNLRDRLAKIRTFQSDMRTLLAMGLSDSAYQQLIDGGVEKGGEYASALVAGGASAVKDMNNLVSQIDKAAETLGTDTSTRLYQAGVDAAQGLVNGLNSLSRELERSAAHLGDVIAFQIKKQLGIKSPSRVMMEAMGFVGDGLADGLDMQHQKVATAADSLSSKISVSPEVAAYEAQQRGAGTVSGNSGVGGFRDLHVHTPSADPKTVAVETLNEVTGRLL